MPNILNGIRNFPVFSQNVYGTSIIFIVQLMAIKNTNAQGLMCVQDDDVFHMYVNNRGVRRTSNVEKYLLDSCPTIFGSRHTDFLCSKRSKT